MPHAPLTELTLYLDGPRVTSDHFTRAMVAFFDLLDEVTQDIIGKNKKIQWVISAKQGSVGIAARAYPVEFRAPVATVAKSAHAGLRLIQRRAQRPAHFTDAALESVRALANVPDGTHVETARIEMGRTSVQMSAGAAEHVDEVFGGVIRDHGTIEGKLESISTRRRPRFVLYDVLTDEPVRCYVKPEQLPKALAAFGARVAVTGIIRYRKDGTPVSIDADDIYPFPNEDDLPAPEEVYGILAPSLQQ